MTTLREAAQQALEALEYENSWHKPRNEKPYVSTLDAITALRAALAEPESTCNGMPVIEGPLSRSQRMREAGFTRRPRGWVKDGDGPEQEPVAFKDAPERVWLQACEDDHCEVSFREHAEITWCADQQNPLDVPYVRADLAAPPQRKPLTTQQILDLFDSHNVYGSKWVEFARAIERAHGIGGQDEPA